MYAYTKELLEIEKITKPILEELKKEDKDGLIDISNLKNTKIETINFKTKKIETKSQFFISKTEGFFRKKIKDYPVLIDLENKLLEYLLEIYQKYKISLKISVIPYCYHPRAAIMTGPTLEQIFKKNLFKKEKIQSKFIITNDKTGELLANLEFEFEKRESEYIIQMEKFTRDFPTTRYIHCILNKEEKIIHLDGSKFYYEKNIQKRIKNPFSFNKEIKKEKIFKIDGNLPNDELIKIGKKYFEINCPYLRIRKKK